MDVEAAVAAPRFHHQWVPDKIRVEPEVPSDVIEGLRERGHEVEVREHWSGGNTILFDPAGRVHYGAPDPRRDSTAQGPRVP